MSQVLLEVGSLIQSAEKIVPGPAYVLIKDGIIVEVGEGRYGGVREGLTVYRRPAAVAMPGFVNAHGHAAMTLLRGIGDDLPLMTWLEEKMFPTEAKLTQEAIYWGTLLACWEMIQSGTTCFTDMYFMMHSAAQAVEESGMRGVLSWGMVGMDQTSRQNGVNNTKSFVRQWHKQASGRITTTLGPHAPYTCPADYLTLVADLSAELDVPIQIHLSETRVEVDNSFREHGKSPIAHSEACGLFTRPVLAAHCVHVSDEDIAILKAHDVRVAHNPQSNLKLGSGVAPIVAMKQAGLTVGLGTDGAASNNNLDMFEELRLAATLHKGIHLDATVIPAAEAFAMATAESARAVFLPEGHGTLTVGARADITLLDLRSPHFQPTHDLLSNVVYASGADDVTDVFVDGQPLLLNREPVTLDTERIRFEVRKIEEFLKR
ncbi:amidohydrolase [Alicyclobacillus pomorum]|jgi:5-methylthioadenosine/S-adenosylhomocysteine deaminase|uniref:amidohydrolase n=1 Tax=Alicyclobacillus pomorum TaxID=204470 RepID=UPI000410E50A|nr:amidohydrolase [Alicyclobacillus pomorum]